MKYEQLVVRKILPTMLPSPVSARHSQYSMLFSADDDVAQPSANLIALSLQAVKHASEVSLADISGRLTAPPYYPDVWPGEHYKILAGIVLTLKPKLIVEIGTYTGISALTMKKYLPPDGKLVTFDIFDWKSIVGTCLIPEDFADGKLFQYTDDLTDLAVVSKHRGLLEQADFIFIDAAKDGVMEQQFIDNLKTISFKKKPLVMFDDIRVWNMLKIWRQISMPKLDLTSFGHWAGTGLVEWQSSGTRP